MVWPNSAHKINKMQSICYCPDWTTTQDLLLGTGISVLARIGMGKKVSTYLDPRILISIFLLAGRLAPWKAGGVEKVAALQEKGSWRLGHGGCFCRRNLNIRRPKINYSYMIHLISESSMWIVKWSRFDEIFTSAVSDRPSEQRFKKSNFWSTPKPLSNIFFGVTSGQPFRPPSRLGWAQIWRDPAKKPEGVAAAGTSVEDDDARGQEGGGDDGHHRQELGKALWRFASGSGAHAGWPMSHRKARPAQWRGSHLLAWVPVHLSHHSI
jgi:hypothetical protein